MNEFEDLSPEETQEMDEAPETRDLAGESDAEDLPEETGLPSPEETELPEPEDLLEDRPALRELTDEERFNAALAMTSALPERAFTGAYERLLAEEAEPPEVPPKAAG